MPLQSSGAISLAQIQTELGGTNPASVDEYTGLFGLKSRFGYQSNNTGLLSVIPGGAAFPPQGFTAIFSGHSDDGSLSELAFNFSYKFLGVTYTGLVVSPNTYITFGGSSSQFSNLSASNPPLPKIFMGSADNSHQRVSFKRGPENSYLHIRSEGAAQANDPGQGNPNIVYEIVFYDPRSTGGNSKFDLYIGNHARLSGLFKICSATSDILVPGNFGDPSEDTSLAQSNSYHFAGDANGNFWTVDRGSVNMLCVNSPTNNPIQFSDFYGLAGAGGGGGGGAVGLLNNLQPLGNYLRNFLAEFQNQSFFNYNLDGDASFIADGGNDMYDNGNFTTPSLLSGTQRTSNAPDASSYPERIFYNNTTLTTVDGDFYYVSVSGYSQGAGTANRPLMVMATRGGIGKPCGWQKGGNSGADGGGSLNAVVLRNGVLYNGFTVHAFTRQTFAATDPSHCDVYVLLGHPNLGSVFGAVSNFADPVGNGSNGGFLITSGAGTTNILAITYLLSKAGGVVVTNAEVDSSINALIDRIKTYFGY